MASTSGVADAATRSLPMSIRRSLIHCCSMYVNGSESSRRRRRRRSRSFHHVDLQLRIRGRNVRRRQAELSANNVAALSDGAGLVEGNLAVASLTSEPAVAGDDELFDGDVHQRMPDLVGDLLGPVGLQRAVADGTDADLLLQVVAKWREQFDVTLIAVLHLQRPDIAAASLEVNLDRVGVAGVLHDALHVRVAPARVDPELTVLEALHFA